MTDYRRVDFSEYWGVTGKIRKGHTKSKNRNLINDDFQGSDLQEASFEELHLVDFKFNNADLRGAKFRNSKLENITIDDAEVGITQRIQKFLKLGIYAVDFMSAITCTYSIAYFLWLFNDLPHKIPDLVGTGLILALYLGSFIFLVNRCFQHGIDGYFSALLLLIPLVSFVYNAVAPEIQATLPLFGLIFFIGTLGGMFAQSQVKYLSKELSFISTLSVSPDWLNLTSLLGLILGTFLSILPIPDSWSFREILITLLSGCLAALVIRLGNLIGNAAYKEKVSLRNISNMLASDDLNSQLTQDGIYDVDFLRNKIVDIINTMTQELKKPNQARYSSIRLAGDSIIDHFKTDFSGAELINVTFKNTILSNSNFSPGLFKEFPGENDARSFLRTALEAVLSRGSTIFQFQTNIENSRIEGEVGIASPIIEINSDRSPLIPQEKSHILEKPSMSGGNQIKVTHSANIGSLSTGDYANVKVATTEITNSFNNSESSEKLVSLVEFLVSQIQVFPPQQKNIAEVNLKHLKEEIQKPRDKQDAKNINCYLSGLVSTAAAVLMNLGVASGEVVKIVANVGDVIGGTRTIAEQVQRIKGNPTEFKALSSSDWEVIETVSVFSDGLSQISEVYQLPTE